MEPKVLEITQRIRMLRDITGMTSAEVAEAAGVTEEEYLRFERGEEDFTFSFLYHCADAFGVDIVELLTGENPHLTGYTIVRGGKGLRMSRREGFDYIHLAANFKDKISEPFLVKAPYREEEQHAEIPMSVHAGQEFDYIISGSLKCVFDGKTEIINAGDSVYYDSGRPHGMIAADPEGCTFLAVVMREDEADA
jgi:transcriptional regulator with XRE-family HTH domain